MDSLQLGKPGLAAAAVAGTAAVATCCCLQRGPSFKQPGWALPGLGHLHMFNIRNLPWELERLRAKVNDKVMALWLGPDYLVYVTTPELTHKVFVEHGDKSSGRSAKMPERYHNNKLHLGNYGIALNDGEAWKKNRQMILRELVSSRERTAVVDQVFQELIDQLGEKAGQRSDMCVPEFGNIVHRSVAAGMCMLIFGFRVSDNVVDEIIEHVDYIGAKSFDYMMLIRIPLYSWFKFETVIRFENSCMRMLKIVEEAVLQRMNSDEFKAKGMKSIVADEHLKETLFEAIQGSLDTTTAVMEWCIAYLADQPAIQKSIHEEMDRLCGPEGPQLEHREKLVLLNAAIMESLRMAQISSLIIPHKATDNIDLGSGYPQIPKGATLLWSFTELHGDEKLWKDPWVFRPDRFITDFPGLTTNPNQGLTSTGEFKKFMPFGIGPRHCPGYHLATYELYVGLSKVLWEYEFSTNEKIDLTHYTESIPVRVRGFKPVVKRRQPKP